MIQIESNRIKQSVAFLYAIFQRIALPIILILGAIIRLYGSTHLSIEVDEPINYDASISVLIHSFPAVRPPIKQPFIPYLFHPPFGFEMLAFWLSLTQPQFLYARLFSVVCSLCAILLLYLFMKRVKKSTTIAALTALLVATDGWVAFVNSDVYLENQLLVLIVAAAWIYYEATLTKPGTRKHFLWYSLAGIAIGITVIFKHIGSFMILSAGFYWLMERKHHKGHFVLFGACVMVIVAYLVLMHINYGNVFDSATLVQIRRTLWLRQSRGLNISPLLAIEAIFDLYWIFVTTVCVLVFGSTTVIWGYIRGFKKQMPIMNMNPFLTSWALGAVAFAVMIHLNSPHYMVMWLLPIYAAITPVLWAIFKAAEKKGWVIPYVLIVAVLLINLTTVAVRFSYTGDTISSSETYMREHLPKNAIVITQSYIGVDLLPSQQYVQIDNYVTVKQVLESGANYAALYTSLSAPLPDGLQNVNSYCTPLETFKGFKDEVVVCKLHLQKK